MFSQSKETHICYRLHLKAFVRSGGRRPTVNQKLDITKRRHRLEGRINSWNQKANQFLHSEELDDEQELQDILEQDAEELQTSQSTEGSSEDTDIDTDIEPESASEVTDPLGLLSAENIRLYLPSSFASNRFPEHARKELDLRLGQANDALHNLRIALGKKSFLFRSHVRAAKSQQRKTRAWSEVSGVEADVRQQARIYAWTRRKMVDLGAGAETLDRYKILRHTDLKISTAVATPNAPGQRDVRLSWFWNMDIQADAETDNWMEECEYITAF
jgi:hypothetical protein